MTDPCPLWPDADPAEAEALRDALAVRVGVGETRMHDYFRGYAPMPLAVFGRIVEDAMTLAPTRTMGRGLVLPALRWFATR